MIHFVAYLLLLLWGMYKRGVCFGSDRVLIHVKVVCHDWLSVFEGLNGPTVCTVRDFFQPPHHVGVVRPVPKSQVTGDASLYVYHG